jgi:hypothetical protein
LLLLVVLSHESADRIAPEKEQIPMKEMARFEIPITHHSGVHSLCWQGDELVDWVIGGMRYCLDGSSMAPRGSLGYRFDRATALSDGLYAVVYEQLGTKGVILKDGRLHREINRSFSEADFFEYPVTLFQLPDGRYVIAHCPDRYEKIEIEELDTGKPLTERQGEPEDFYHSRLQLSPDGCFLLSAGWIWHPLDEIEVYDVGRALREPESLDRSRGLEFTERIGMLQRMYEVHSAVFLDAQTLLFYGDICGGADAEARSLGAYDLVEERLLWMTPLDEVVGTMMSLGEFVVGFYEHPKLIELHTGEVVHRWPEIHSGRQNSSIISNVVPLPPIALDPANKRFAVAAPEKITVVQLG